MTVVRLVVVCFAVVCLLPVSGFAQSAEVAGGYQFTAAFAEDASQQFPGWVASAGAYATPGVAVVGEVSGGYGIFRGATIRNHTFLGGAHFLLPSSPVFVRALAGVENFRAGGALSSTAFAVQPGIGVDAAFRNSTNTAFRITGSYRYAFHAGGGTHDLLLTIGIAAKF